MSKEDIISGLLEDFRKEGFKKDYSRLGLKLNPFPLAGLPKYVLPPLDPEIEEKIKHFIISTYKKDDYSGLTIAGDYGSGKTHLLKYIQFLIDELTREAQKHKIDFSAITCFIDRPEDSPQKVVHKIVEDIGLDKIRKYVWKIVIDKFSSNKAEFYQKHKPRGLLLPQEPEKWRELFEEPVRSNYLDFLKRFRDLSGDFERLQNSVLEIIKVEIVPDSALADRYLDLILYEEEKTTSTSWDVLAGYVSKRDIQHKETIFLYSIVEILRKVGFKHLYVFVDEFEDIGKLTAAKKTSYLLTLVTLINKESHWSVIISLTPDVLNEEIAQEPPLHDRLTTTIIELKPLDRNAGYNLLVKYLNVAREKEEDSLHPFTEESVGKMIEISEGNCRSFLMLAFNAIEIALKEKKAKISMETVKKAKILRGI